MNPCHWTEGQKSEFSKAPGMVTFKPVQSLSAIFNSFVSRSSSASDFVLRLPLVIFFGLLAFNVSPNIVMFVVQCSTFDLQFKGRTPAALLANTLFLFTLLSLT